MFKKFQSKYWLLVIILLIISVFLFINLFILLSTQSLIWNHPQNMPPTQVALILGAKVFANGRLSDMLQDRADQALLLYRNKKVSKILISGDHGTPQYDEVNAVKNYLLLNGVLPQDIFLDHAGFDTYDSLYRAKEIFQISSLVICTQNFHLPRALYIAKNLDIEAFGLNSNLHIYKNIQANDFRENLARIKAFLDILLKNKPKYLGHIIPITGNGQETWD